MKAIILAAGRGARMRPLTDTTPKPLLQVRGKALIEWHLDALARDGITEVVINTAWLEERLVESLGDGSRYGVTIRWSMEGRDHGGALETAGGIATALPMLGDAFWVVSGDIFMPGFRFDPAAAERFLQSDALAHLWLVPNPPFHPTGDFDLHGQRRTYANIALMRPALVADIPPGTHAPLGPRLIAGMRDGRITAELWQGEWENVGTPAQLAALNPGCRASDA